MMVSITVLLVLHLTVNAALAVVNVCEGVKEVQPMIIDLSEVSSDVHMALIYEYLNNSIFIRFRTFSVLIINNVFIISWFIIF